MKLKPCWRGKPRAGLASMNLGELEDGVSADEQVLEVLGKKIRRRRTRKRCLTAEKYNAPTWQSA